MLVMPGIVIGHPRHGLDHGIDRLRLDLDRGPDLVGIRKHDPPVRVIAIDGPGDEAPVPRGNLEMRGLIALGRRRPQRPIAVLVELFPAQEPVTRDDQRFLERQRKRVAAEEVVPVRGDHIMPVRRADIQARRVEDQPGGVRAGAPQGVMDGTPEGFIERDRLGPDLLDLREFRDRHGIAAVLDHLAPDREPDGDPVAFHRGDDERVLAPARFRHVVEILVGDQEHRGCALRRSLQANHGGAVEVGCGQFELPGLGALDAHAAEHRQGLAPVDDLAKPRKGGFEGGHWDGDGIHCFFGPFV